MIRPSFLERLLLLYARRFPLVRGKYRLVNALWRQAIPKGASTMRTARLAFGGYQVPADLSEMLQRQFYFFGTYFLEREILDCWAREAQKAQVVVDVGANAGIFSLAAIAANPNCRVHAFEPTPEIAARLRETISMNRLSNLQVHEQAVSNKEGFLTLVRFRGDGTNEGMNYIDPDEPSGGNLQDQVPTVTLDRFCQDQGLDRIDLMKMDIQGAEYAALQGAQALLGSGRIDVIFMELNWSSEPTACPATQSIGLLEDAGYWFSAPGPRLEWRSSGVWMRSLGDIVAMRPPE